MGKKTLHNLPFLEKTKKNNRKDDFMSQFMQQLTENAYFQSLPKWVQESVMQSPLNAQNEEELRLFVNQLLRSNDN